MNDKMVIYGLALKIKIRQKVIGSVDNYFRITKAVQFFKELNFHGYYLA